jgi:HemY protein
MRGVIWLVLLFVAAVVAALTLGENDGLASFTYNGWRLDMSLNLFLLGALVVASCGDGDQGIDSLSRCRCAPRVAALKRERAMQGALR